VVALHTTMFNIEKLYMVLTVYMCFVDLRTNDISCCM